MKSLQATLALASSALLIAGCAPTESRVVGSGGDDEFVTDNGSSGGTNLGDPLPGLTQTELDAFNAGRIQFNRVWTPEEGLGPHYNATSCVSCHSNPVPGGNSKLYRNFFVAQSGFTPDTSFDLPGLISPIVPFYGTGVHAAQTLFTLEGGRNIIFDDIFGIPVTKAQRSAIPIFGTGLFEFISDVEILSNADPDDLDADGISGRANNDVNGMGRFGVKAQANNVEIFTRTPAQNQMGITSDPVLGSGGIASIGHMAFQGSGGIDDPTTDNDPVPDPEMETEDMADLIAFARFLAPPSPKPVFTAEEINGEAIFTSLGCVKCHIPTLNSSRGPVNAYTDLLIHDMGPGLADNLGFGIPQTSTIDPNHTGSEFRTAPLWGISNFGPYLHDGRAVTLTEAIDLHGGEAQVIRDAFDAMSQSDKDDVIAFLEAL